tara:strand:+ start:365 stop:1102 length:738 start_codon:yes stop_codon:yes gene_type:complete
MKLIERFDAFLVDIINKVDNFNKYNQTYSKKYSLDDKSIKDTEVFKFYEKTILDLLNNSEKKPSHEKSILDIGCGTGRFLNIFSNEIIVGIDININMLNQAKQLKTEEDNWLLLNLDLTRFNQLYPEYNFDLIYSIGVFGEHAFMDITTLEIVIKHMKVNSFFFFTIYQGGLRRKGIIRLCIKLLNILLTQLGLKKSAMYISRESNLDDIISKFDNINVKYKTLKTSNTKNWTGSHLIYIIEKIV